LKQLVPFNSKDITMDTSYDSLYTVLCSELTKFNNANIAEIVDKMLRILRDEFNNLLSQ
jgi:flagellin-specific chaperone FliS